MSVYNLSGGLVVTTDSITYENLNFVLEGGVTAPIDYLHLSTSIFSLEGNVTTSIDYLTLESTPITPSWTEQILSVFRMIYPILLLLLIMFFIALLIKVLRDFLKEKERRKRISETHAVA
jgi:hypothetical protein